MKDHEPQGNKVIAQETVDQLKKKLEKAKEEVSIFHS